MTHSGCVILIILSATPAPGSQVEGGQGPGPLCSAALTLFLGRQVAQACLSLTILPPAGQNWNWDLGAKVL